MLTENQLKAVEIGTAWIQKKLDSLQENLELAVELDKLAYAPLVGAGNTHGDNLYCKRFSEAIMNEIYATITFAKRTIPDFDKDRKLERHITEYLNEHKSRLRNTIYT